MHGGRAYSHFICCTAAVLEFFNKSEIAKICWFTVLPAYLVDTACRFLPYLDLIEVKLGLLTVRLRANQTCPYSFE